MKPSEYLLILKKQTAEEVKGLNPKSRKFIKVMSKVDLEYGKELDKKFIDKQILTLKILEYFKNKKRVHDDTRCKTYLEFYDVSINEILKLLEE